MQHYVDSAAGTTGPYYGDVRVGWGLRRAGRTLGRDMRVMAVVLMKNKDGDACQPHIIHFCICARI